MVPAAVRILLAPATAGMKPSTTLLGKASTPTTPALNIKPTMRTTPTTTKPTPASTVSVSVATRPPSLVMTTTSWTPATPATSVVGWLAHRPTGRLTAKTRNMMQTTRRKLLCDRGFEILETERWGELNVVYPLAARAKICQKCVFDVNRSWKGKKNWN